MFAYLSKKVSSYPFLFIFIDWYKHTNECSCLEPRKRLYRCRRRLRSFKNIQA